jgi:hypothetical protein
MIRSILLSVAISTSLAHLATRQTSALAAFPVLMNDQVPSNSLYSNYGVDSTRAGRTIVSLGLPGETVFHVLDGRNDTPTNPSRISSGNWDDGASIFGTPSGSTWMLRQFNLTPISPFQTQDFLAFDQNGQLRSAITQTTNIGSTFITNDLGSFVLSGNRIFNFATRQSQSFNACVGANGGTILNCTTTRFLNPVAVGLGQSIWALRSVGTTDSALLQLVQMSVSGQQRQVLDLIEQPGTPFTQINVVAGQLRVWASAQGQRASFLFNISTQKSAQIQSAGRISGPPFSARALGNGDWLVFANGRYSQFALHTYNGAVEAIASSHEFETTELEVRDFFDTNNLGDTLLCFYQLTPLPSCQFEWRDAQGTLLMRRNDWLQAKFEPSGNLLTIAADGETGRIFAKRLNRDGLQVDETEGFTDTPVRPERVHLFRGSNDSLLSVSGYSRARENVIHRINLDGSRERVGSFGPLGFASFLHAAGSPWISQISAGTFPLESVNIQTGARFFVAPGARIVAVGDAIYEFRDSAGVPSLRIIRGGQAGSVTLPAFAGTVLAAKAVNPALANQDELRFVVVNRDTNQQVVMGVRNGQATERFQLTNSGQRLILSDGSVIASGRKFSTDGRLIEPYALCDTPTEAADDGKGGIWTLWKIDNVFRSPVLVCHTSADGTFSYALTPSYANDVLSVTEDGDLFHGYAGSQTRYHVVDGIVRHHTRVQEATSKPIASRAALNIADKLYFSAERTLVSETGVRTIDMLVEQTDLIPIARVIDQYTSNGFE